MLSGCFKLKLINNLDMSNNLASCAYDTLIDISTIVDLSTKLKTTLNENFGHLWNVSHSF